MWNDGESHVKPMVMQIIAHVWHIEQAKKTVAWEIYRNKERKKGEEEERRKRRKEMETVIKL